jgi:hypothetical protein
VPAEVPTSSKDFSEVLSWCWQHYFRINGNGLTVVKSPNGWKRFDLIAVYTEARVRWLVENSYKSLIHTPSNIKLAVNNRLNRLSNEATSIRGINSIHKLFLILRSSVNLAFASVPFFLVRFKLVVRHLKKPWLFTNACGDFTLLSKSDWTELQAYPEWAMYSFHLDSVLLYQAKAAGIKERYMGKRAAVFHIEHQPGSGFTPEDPSKLFDRLIKNGIPFLDWNTDAVPLIEKINAIHFQTSDKLYQFAGNGWGLADLELQETKIGVNP